MRRESPRRAVGRAYKSPAAFARRAAALIRAEGKAPVTFIGSDTAGALRLYVGLARRIGGLLGRPVTVEIQPGGVFVFTAEGRP